MGELKAFGDNLKFIEGRLNEDDYFELLPAGKLRPFLFIEAEDAERILKLMQRPAFAKHLSRSTLVILADDKSKFSDEDTLITCNGNANDDEYHTINLNIKRLGVALQMDIQTRYFENNRFTY